MGTPENELMIGSMTIYLSTFMIHENRTLMAKATRNQQVCSECTEDLMSVPFKAVSALKPALKRL